MKMFYVPLLHKWLLTNYPCKLYYRLRLKIPHIWAVNRERERNKHQLAFTRNMNVLVAGILQSHLLSLWNFVVRYWSRALINNEKLVGWEPKNAISGKFLITCLKLVLKIRETIWFPSVMSTVIGPKMYWWWHKKACVRYLLLPEDNPSKTLVINFVRTAFFYVMFLFFIFLFYILRK